MGRMMLEPIPAKWKALWDIWDLRSVIILSLSLQTVLIFVAPLRKRKTSIWVTITLWSAYLLADWAANFAVGLILNSQGDSSSKNGIHGDLLAFWAPFLLVHLGGPDTITAFALEDNELWLRHLFGLVFQCIAVFYVFILSLPHNRLWIPTVLMLLTGMIKYIERTRSLYLASADVFKHSTLKEVDTGQNYANLMNLYFSVRSAKLPVQMSFEPDTVANSKSKAMKGNLTELQVVQYGHRFFKKFIGLFVDMRFSLKERDLTRDFFFYRNARDAFSVIEVELNFIYEVLFTKLPVVYGRFGFISRIVSLTTICLAIILFILKSKTNFTDVDVTITYALLFGALVLDLTSLFMLLFSDWAIDQVSRQLKIPTLLRFLSRRWSETIDTYNLIDYCLHRRSVWEKVFDKFGVTGFLDGIVYVNTEEFSLTLRDFIFLELKSKAELADDLETAKAISSSRGDWVLRVEEGWSSLLKYVVDFEYDQSLIVWHIATELCYNKDLYDNLMKINNKAVHDDELYSKNRDNSKLLSDYMMYLLVMQSSMMSSVPGIAQIRVLDSLAEVRAQIKRISFSLPSERILSPMIHKGLYEDSVS